MELIRTLLVCLIFGGILQEEQRSQPAIVYSHQELLYVAPFTKHIGTSHNIPTELLWRTRRGARAGAKRNRRQRKRIWKESYKLALPSIIMGNVWSMNNKMEELETLVRSQKSTGTAV